MMKKVLFVFLTILFSKYSISQEIIQPSNIKWYTITQAFELAKKEPRPILIDVYTDWCSWCKFMMKTTFANNGIANYINTYFYPVRFNAETLDTINFKGRKYFNRRIGRRPTHDLASILLDGKLSYPSLVYFDRDGNKTVIPGYKESKDIEPALVYFAENLHKRTSLNEFVINFIYSFPNAFEKDHSIFKIDDIIKPDTLGKINWVAPEEILALSMKKPKPIMLFFYTDWCISCKVMEKTSFGDRNLAAKINKNFYPVKIDAFSNDTINFLGKNYTGNNQNQPNQLARTVLNEDFSMPAVVLYDENNNVLSKLNGYLVKSQMLPLTTYFSDKSYKKLSFQEYLKAYLSEKQTIENN